MAWRRLAERKLHLGKTGRFLDLADSILRFPSPEEFKGFMEGAGFVDVEMIPLTLGIAYLHTGYKP